MSSDDTWYLSFFHRPYGVFVQLLLCGGLWGGERGREGGAGRRTVCNYVLLQAHTKLWLKVDTFVPDDFIFHNLKRGC